MPYRNLSTFFIGVRLGRIAAAPVTPDAWANDPDRTTRREAY